MIRELYYEYILFFANLLGGQKRQGFFDDNKIFIKTDWLEWEVYKIQDLDHNQLKELTSKVDRF
jgi:hypothetical protein